MDWTLEVVVVPVADMDRAKSFYAGKVGFYVDHDTTVRAVRSSLEKEWWTCRPAH